MDNLCVNQSSGKNWSLYQGDCIPIMDNLPKNSIGLSVFSPPFSNLYIYSDSECDMGNCKSDEEFFDHFKYVARGLHRITIPGRLAVIHCKDLPLYFGRDGASGLKDFPGEIIRTFSEFGWTYHSRITIWKCPVIERERTNNNGLLHKTILRDRSQSRQGMADYLIVLRKTTKGTLLSDQPVIEEGGLNRYIGLKENDPRKPKSKHPSPYARKTIASNNSINIWRRYAEPVWWDIRQTNVLNHKLGTDNKDEKHICPLQLDVIERAVQLWSNEGDIVFSPFAGIGSEGFISVKMNRKFIGIELKESYFKIAVKNLEAISCGTKQQTLL